MSDPFRIGGRGIGTGLPVYVIAEMSANHGRDFERALRIIAAAKEAGADAVKLQTYTADTLTIQSDNECFQIGKGTIWEGRTLYGLYEEASTPWEWQPKLLRAARELGLQLFSTPFDFTAVDFLEDMGVPAYKLASFEIVDLSLIRKIARTGKPLIMSTGMASEEEIDEAVRAFRESGGDHLALLKCTSAYPAPPAEMNLRGIPYLAERFGAPVGISDHTLGSAAAVVATTLGACLVEKHLTLSRAEGGPDAPFSAEPEEFRNLVTAVRFAEKALGSVKFGPGAAESSSLAFRRSLFAVRDIPEGSLFTVENVRSIRPGNGLKPKYYETVLGRRASRDIRRGTPLSWDHVEGGRKT